MPGRPMAGVRVVEVAQFTHQRLAIEQIAPYSYTKR